MSHSIQGGFNRKTTKELEKILACYLDKNDIDKYGTVILTILDILHQRKTLKPLELSPEIKARLEKHIGPID